ncbi:FAD dependent oxidoreductase [Chaetomium strumarium]|uniref:FAD dependent oxidoreductase n=1 Tax=Chaetomium strumarium TaxID=1170767 RepID=A0AAJ0GNY8_9PEZI|nr:FAD dependent oxidoreductase [Chaetomium strumarium]
MDERAKIPVSLPSANPTVSYWQEPPDTIADHRSTPDLPASVDTVIIGSGITGAAVAWNLLSQTQSTNPGGIVMLEARQACSGATGRNGGHTKSASYRTFAHHASTLGLAAAKQIARLELANIQAVHAFAREHSIDCDLTPCQTVDVIYDRAQWDEAVASVRAMRDAFPHGEPEGQYELFSPEDVKERFHVHDGAYQGREERVQGGVGYFAGSLSAYKFGLGVLKLCLERGLNLQTGTPVTGLEKKKKKKKAGEREGMCWWEVKTPRGPINAKRVVLAANGYTAAVWPRFQGVVVPLRGQVTAQRPGSKMPRRGCLPTTYSFIYKKGYEYMVPRPEGSRFAGDIVIGGGLVRAPDDGLLEFGTTDDGAVNEGISQYLRETTPRYFGPDWGDDDPEGRVRSEWTGVMGFSPDGFPLVGNVPGEDGLWASCSFQGHGMVLCWMCAKALVEMMEDGDSEQLRDWFPDVFRITEERLSQSFQGRLDAIPKAGDHIAGPPRGPSSGR